MVSHPGVKEAAAIGVPCAEWGEKVVAVIVPHADPVDPAEIQDLVRSELRSSRVPEHVVVVDELPWNETGKLLRRVLRTDLAHLGDGSTD